MHERTETTAARWPRNQGGGRKVPEDAPTSFVPARDAEYLAKARKDGDETADVGRGCPSRGQELKAE